MGKLFLMILNTMRSGSGTMLVPMKEVGAMIGPAVLIGQGTLIGEGRTCRTSRTEMGLRGRVTTALHHPVRTKCHHVRALRTMRRATCLRHHHHLMQVVPRQTTSKVVLLATHRGDTPLVVLLATKVDLLGIKVVTKVTKGIKARLTKVTKVEHQVTKVVTRHPLTREATPTHHPLTRGATPTHHLRTKVAILAMVAAVLATQAQEATQTTNELDHEHMQAPLFQSTLLENMVCGSINGTFVAV
jgi:hypothetical protein